MYKSGGLIGIIAGVFGVIAAIATIFIGGVGSALDANDAGKIVNFGWAGLGSSFLIIVLGAMAFAWPLISGIGIVIFSVVGAIYGGTMVAICMALSCIGGVICLISGAGGSRKSGHSSGDLDGKELATSKAGIYKGIAVFVGLIVLSVVLLEIQASSKPKSSSEAAEVVKPIEDPITELANTSPSELRPEGELSEMFVYGSSNTDLQRENKLKELNGQIVEWTLPVYEVSRHGEGYKIRTESHSTPWSHGQKLLDASVYITARDENEKKYLEGLKTGDLFRFKGRLTGKTFMRALEIKPAILVLSEKTVVVESTSPVISAAPVLPAPEQPATTPAITTEDQQAPKEQSNGCKGSEAKNEAEQTECIERKKATQ